MAELSSIVEMLEQEREVQFLILRGEQGTFCAGADLGTARNHLMSSEGGSFMSALMTDTLVRLQQLPLISIAYIQGAAIGGRIDSASNLA